MTLLEVMLALALLLGLFLGAVSLLPSVLRTQAGIERQDLAAVVAALVLADARQLPFPALVSGRGESEMEITTGGVKRVERYTYEVEALPLDESLKDLVVTVSWDEGVRQLVVQTRIFEDSGSGW